MTEEKKGFSFFKFLLTLCILGGLVGGGLWAYQQNLTKENWADVIKAKALEIKKYLPKTNKTESKVQTPIASQPATPAPEKSTEVINSEQEALNEEMNAEVIPDELPPMAMDAMPLDSVEPLSVDSFAPENIDSVTTETNELDEMDSITTEKNELDDIEPISPQEEIALGEPTQTIETNIQEEVKKVPASGNSTQKFYTWKNFISGEKCNHTTLPQLKETTKKKLLSYCQHPSGDAWHLWLNDFREAKKRFFVQEILKENSKYFKYLKTIPYLLFDIQKTKAEGSSLHDQFDKIESAIVNKQTEEAVLFIQQMNHLEAKKALNGILLEGQNLLEIQSAFENK